MSQSKREALIGPALMLLDLYTKVYVFVRALVLLPFRIVFFILKRVFLFFYSLYFLFGNLYTVLFCRYGITKEQRTRFLKEMNFGWGIVPRFIWGAVVTAVK